MGLSFLHLIPDTLHEFQKNAPLAKLQKAYPFAELVVMLGMIMVLAAEKLASIIQINRENKKSKCDGSENCCKVTCEVQQGFYKLYFQSFVNNNNHQLNIFLQLFLFGEMELGNFY